MKRGTHRNLKALWPSGPELSDREREVLNELCGSVGPRRDGWVTPMWVGGKDASHHSATLAKLTRKGLAERRVRAGYTRPSYLYRATKLGHELRSRK